MDHGFRREHFDLLRQWGWRAHDPLDAAHAQARERLRGAWSATETWGSALQQRLFPLGRTKIRKAPISQGHSFTPYTWAKIYPAPSSPRELAFTVGIDPVGFVVKIDTVGRTAARGAYEALRGPDNEGSPFAAILPVEDGLRLSFEQLVAWSARAIAEFRMGYDEVLERIGLTFPKLELITDEVASRAAFAAWREALLEGAIPKGAFFWLPEGGIVLRAGRSGRTPDDDRMALGTDPSGRKWAVEINEPRVAGDHNPLSAISVDAAGERFLLRQGFLRPNDGSGHTISGSEFIERTGLAPVPVEAEGAAAKRQWYRVCSLDSGADEIRRATSDFVDRCAAARIAADAHEAPVAAIQDLFASGESGESYKRRARPAEAERNIRRLQGIVWLALAERLARLDISIRKGRHPLGYEVDAEIESGAEPPLLVEIKSGTSAGDIHTGVGQLHLYPRLIDRLATFERALLLPGLPNADVRAAVESCGIAIYTFELDDPDSDHPSVTFSPEFLQRCGVRDE